MLTQAPEQFRLNAVAGYIESRPDNDELVSLCELAALLCDAPIAAINLLDHQFQHTVAAYGADSQICAKEDSMCATTIAADEDIYLEDARLDPRFEHHPWVDGRRGTVRLYAATVLRAPTGAAVGTLCVIDARTDRPVEHRPEVAAQRQRVLATLGRQVIDLFELRIRTDVLTRTNVELARSQEHLAAFAAQISHDLKTPLTATLGFAELLTELPSVADDPVAARYADRCRSSSQRMLEMIDELLGYARLGGTLQRRWVALGEILPPLLEDLGELAQCGTVRWFGDDVYADPAQLRALLQNLVTNALTYTRDGVPPEVVITSLDTPIGVELLVADNGSGIPPARRDDVLLPLIRLNSDVPGTGIGLATCNRIVTGHGGVLQMGDTPGGGTTITIVLPH
jgi:signal transduction histidine kinase